MKKALAAVILTGFMVLMGVKLSQAVDNWASTVDGTVGVAGCFNIEHEGAE